MSQRDTIDGMTAAEAILSRIIEEVAHMPSDSAFHARQAIMIVNRMIMKKLYVPSDRPYHLRVMDIGGDCCSLAAKPCLDKYGKQVYQTVERVAYDYYETVEYHENMEAPLPF